MSYPHTFLLLSCVIASGCGVGRQLEQAPKQGVTFEELATRYWQHSLAQDPLRASSLGYRTYDDRLPDLSSTARAHHMNRLKAFLNALERVQERGLTGSIATYAAVLQTEIQRHISSAVCQDWNWVIDQLNGPQVRIAGIPNYHRIDRTERADALLKRYAAVGSFFDQHIENLRQGLAARRVASRVNVSRVIEQLTRMLAVPPNESPFVRTVVQNADVTVRSSLHDELVRATRAHIYPALRHYLVFLRDTIEPHSRTSVAVSDLPDGRECYQARITYHTGLRLTADQIHTLGLQEVERIHGEMKTIVHELGSDDVETFLGRLADRPDQHLKTREALLDYNRGLVERARAALGKLVGRRPRTPLVVKPIETFREQDAPAAYYYSAPSDGSRPAAYFLNTHAPETRLLYKMPALAFHEALPGHHLQLSLSAENPDLPMFMRHGGHTSFIEGWALYSEKLAGEFGLYETPEEKLGALTYEIWRAARLVVDTGLHAKGWSRDQAIDYLSLTTGHDPGEVINEVDRYIIWPGQALAYKMGQLALSRLRAEVQDTLGDGFDLRAFHDAVLRHGALPLDVLRVVIEQWLGREAPR